MSKRGAILILLSVLLPLCGCQRALIGEAEAVAAARALLTQAYGDIPARCEIVLKPTASTGPLYEIYFPQKEGYECFARVAADSGKAYQAERLRESLPMTDAQRAEAEALGDLDNWSGNFDGYDACQKAAVAFAEERFAMGRRIERTELSYDMTDNCQFPLIDVGYHIWFDDGEKLCVVVVWPQCAVFCVGY